MARTGRARNKRLLTYLWVLVLAIVTIVLIYKEQTAVLYILATLGVTAILCIVAFADLHKGEVAHGDTSAKQL